MRPLLLVLPLCVQCTAAKTWRSRIEHNTEHTAIKNALPSSSPSVPAPATFGVDNDHQPTGQIPGMIQQRTIGRDLPWRPVLDSWLHQSNQESDLGEKELRVLAEFNQFLVSTGLMKPPARDEMQPSKSQLSNDKAERRVYTEEYQRSARQRRVTASRQRLEGLLTSALSQMQRPQKHLVGRRARRKVKSNLPQQRDTDLTLAQLNMLVETLQSAKQAALEAVELDGGSETAPTAWIPTLNLFLDVLPATRAVTAPEAAPNQLSYGFWPFHDRDVIELASALCRFHSSLRPSIRDLIPNLGTHADNTSLPILECGSAPPAAAQDQSHFARGLSPLTGGELITAAPMQPSWAAGKGASEQIRRLEAGLRSGATGLKLRTHQLWPTLVSTLNVVELQLVDQNFLESVSNATLEGYSQFLEIAPPQQFAGQRNNQFYQWQAIGNSPLNDSDYETIRDLAVRACLAHTLSHRRPQNLEELGWPEPFFEV
jgi:hypothetical protein